jgi:RNA polymerase sigma-70 factor (ECF subfamily)
MSVTLDVDAETREAKLAMGGDARARDRLFEQIYARVLRYHRKLAAGHPGLAEELTQETLLRLIRSFDQLREPERVVPWAFRIATNVWRDHHRPKKRPAEGLPVRVPGSACAAEREELSERVLDLLGRLPDTYRIVLTLRYLEGLDYESIAAVLEIAIPTLRSQIARGRQMIRRLLGDES